MRQSIFRKAVKCGDPRLDEKFDPTGREDTIFRNSRRPEEASDIVSGVT